MDTLTVAKRFCGPPTSANGGYFCGLVASHGQEAVTVRLIKPPPLDVPLTVRKSGEGVLEVTHGDTLIAQARPHDRPTLAPPAPPRYVEVVEASRHYVGFTQHPFPTCFVCGPQRSRGDGLRIFPGPVAGSDLVAGPWMADPSLDAGDGKVRPEFMWAALDCPGWLAVVRDARMALLGEFAAHVDRCVHVDERCVVVGWHIQSIGRKHEAGTALFDEDGELCGQAHAIWIEPRAG
jgi:hypothetical protein